MRPALLGSAGPTTAPGHFTQDGALHTLGTLTPACPFLPAYLFTKRLATAAAGHPLCFALYSRMTWADLSKKLHEACAECPRDLQSVLPSSAARQLGKSSPPDCLQNGLHSPRGRQGVPPWPNLLSHNQKQLSFSRSSTNSLWGHPSSLQPPWKPQQTLPGSSSHPLSPRPMLRTPHSQAQPTSKISSLLCSLWDSRLCWAQRGAGRAQASWLAQHQPGWRWTVTCPRGRGPVCWLGTSRTRRWQPAQIALTKHHRGQSTRA